MTQTLQDLIAANDFTGYPVSSAAWRFEADEIEEAIYGPNAASCLPYDLVETFANRFNVDLVAINTWICTDTEVGLEVLRLQGMPMGLLWQSARKASRHIAFFDNACMRSVRSAWESVKTIPEPAANFVPEDLLSMPLAGPGETGFHIESYDRVMPSLSKSGAIAWIEAEGGLDAITNRAALGHVEHALKRDVENSEATLARLRDVEPAPQIKAAIETEIENLVASRDALDALRESVRQRIFAIS